MTKEVIGIISAPWLMTGLKIPYTGGFQRSTCGIFIPYQKHGKVFIYFALERAAKIYSPHRMHLKNKNIFATMISIDRSHTQLFSFNNLLRSLKQ
jgi:hypothetical protein